MDTGDIYCSRRILYKCDNLISNIYSKLFRALSDPSAPQDEATKNEMIKQIDIVIFQIFKYKTALLSLEKDIRESEEGQVVADRQIQRSKEEIKVLTDSVKSAETVRRHKLEYNEIAKSVKEFDTITKLNAKIKEVELEVEKLVKQHQQEAESYAEKERLFKIAFSALIALKSEDEAGGFGQSPLSGM